MKRAVTATKAGLEMHHGDDPYWLQVCERVAHVNDDCLTAFVC
jgi:hypothetical protein